MTIKLDDHGDCINYYGPSMQKGINYGHSHNLITPKDQAILHQHHMCVWNCLICARTKIGAYLKLLPMQEQSYRSDNSKEQSNDQTP